MLPQKKIAKVMIYNGFKGLLTGLKFYTLKSKLMAEIGKCYGFVRVLTLKQNEVIIGYRSKKKEKNSSTHFDF